MDAQREDVRLGVSAEAEGRRTAFGRSGTAFQALSSYHLGCAAVAGLLHHTGVDPERIGTRVKGRVVPDPQTTNLGREVVFRASLPMQIPGTTVNLACASSIDSATESGSGSRRAVRRLPSASATLSVDRVNAWAAPRS